MLQDLEQINQEMETLRQQMSNALKVVDSLSEIQNQFIDLAQTYHSFQAWLEQNQQNSLQKSALSDLQSQIEERIMHLQQEVEQVKQPIRALISTSDQPSDSILALSLDQITKGFRYRIDQLETIVFQQRTSLQLIEQQLSSLNVWVMLSLIIGMISLGIPLTKNFIPSQGSEPTPILNETP